MEQQISETKLFRSCEILFGTDLHVSRQFLDYLQIGGIKNAYRKRAMETHPDRLIGLDLPLQNCGSERFQAVQEAYRTLLSFLKTKETRSRAIPAGKNSGNLRPKPSAPSAPSARPARQRPASSHSARSEARLQSFLRNGTIRPITLPDQASGVPVYANTHNLYQGPLPRRQLLFGHFLYYSGLANWRTIARILTWQRTERPRLGELARHFGICRQEDVATILRARQPHRHFGETARMLGILTEQQVKVLMFHQRRLQKKFGAILLEKSLISEPELQELLDRFECHNAALRTQ